MNHEIVVPLNYSQNKYKVLSKLLLSQTQNATALNPHIFTMMSFSIDNNDYYVFFLFQVDLS